MKHNLVTYGLLRAILIICTLELRRKGYSILLILGAELVKQFINFPTGTTPRMDMLAN